MSVIKNANGIVDDWLNGQGWFANAICISPFDENVVFVGGLDLHQITVDPDSERQSAHQVTIAKEIELTCATDIC